jgi:ERCC4-related helicase
MPGKLYILITKNTRDEIYHYSSAAKEKKMYKTIESVQKEIKSKEKTLEEFK